MNTEEIKSRLHEGIENIDDNEFLLAIKELIERKYNPLNFTELSELQMKRIKDSGSQIKNGEFFTNKQVNEIIDKWLEK